MKGIKSLEDNIINIPQVNEVYAEKLNRLGIFDVKDLLTNFPRDYTDSSDITPINELGLMHPEGLEFTIKCRINNFRSIYLRSRKTLQTAKAVNESGSVECVWFNQPFLKNTFNNPKKQFLLKGKIKYKGKKVQFLPSSYDEVSDEKENVHLGRIVPEYRLTEGITKKWFRNRVKYAIDQISEHNLDIPFELENYLKNIDLKAEIKNLHFPESYERLDESIYKLSLIELIDIHLKILKSKSKQKRKDPIEIEVEKYKSKLNEFIKSIPFELTRDQVEVITRVVEKLQNNVILNELIQGDVGSGKTIVIIILSYLMLLNDLQTIVLVPTTVLAKQHFETFKKYLKGFENEVELAISENKMTEGKKIIIGTSAVLARKKKLIKKVGLIIVDEQHRFGVEQREELLKPFKESFGNSKVPHFINMTATPIPRTIAETFFGNVNVNTIQTKPKDRLEIKTFVINEEKRKDCLTWLKNKIKTENEQVYWICPLVEDSEEINAKSAKQTYEKLRKLLPDINIGLLHGKMKPTEKQKAMESFVKNKTNLLVATTVIEVGIDVSNASIMIIENPERFGLAQLHQIRGRVGRGAKQSYCFLFTGEEANEGALERLNFFAEQSDGLKIAEYDLQRRGPGEVYGIKQSGIPDLKIAKLSDLELIKKSKQIAEIVFSEGINDIQLFR